MFHSVSGFSDARTRFLAKVGNAFPSFLWNVFQPRSDRVPTAFGTRLERVRNANAVLGYFWAVLCLKHKATRTKSRYFYETYKSARNKTNKIVEKAKSRHFQHTINNNSNNPKQLWKIVNLIRGKGSKATNVPTLKLDEETITGDKNIAEAFNFFSYVWVRRFRKVYQTLKKAILIMFNIPCTIPFLYWG
jgi:hypothetical protein